MDSVSMLPKKTTNGFTPQTLDWYEGVLSQFPGEHRRKSKTDADVICPAHDDHNPSLGVDLRFNGGVSVTAYGCTLEAYAAYKNLPLEFLTSDDVALVDGSCYVKALGKEIPAVEIPYADQNGEQVATRYRISSGGDDKFRWERGSKTILYGLHRLEEAHDAGYVLLVEGESDCHTAW